MQDSFRRRGEEQKPEVQLGSRKFQGKQRGGTVETDDDQSTDTVSGDFHMRIATAIPVKIEGVCRRIMFFEFLGLKISESLVNEGS